MINLAIIATSGEATEVPIKYNIKAPAWLDQLWEMCKKSPRVVKGENFLELTMKSWASL